MKIKELTWLMDNRELLTEEETRQLAAYDLFNQYDAGEVQQNGVAMIEMLNLVQNIYGKYQADEVVN